jgi:hypothetical protein
MIRPFESVLTNKIYKSAIVLLIFLPVLFINVRSSHNWGGDFAQYINQAKCISEGRSQSETGYIFNEQNPYLGPPSYPIGFPLILAPIYYFFGNNILAFSFLISIFLLALSFILVKIFNLYFNYLISVLMAVAFIYNPWLLRFKSSIVSDIPFAFFFLLGIYFYMKKFNSEKTKIRFSVLLGLLICISMLIKSIGALIIFGIFFEKIVASLKNRNFKFARFHDPLIILVSILFFYILSNYIIFPTDTEHYSFFSTLFNLDNIVGAIKSNYSYYFVLIKNYFSDDVVISAITITLFLLGFIKKIISKADIADYIFTAYLIIIFSFPAVQGFRYLLPIYPIILIYIVFGFKSIKINFPSKRNVFLTIAVSSLLILIYYNGISSVIKSQKKTLAGPQTSYSIETFHYIQKNTDENSIFAFIKPRVLALYTTRQSIGIGKGKSIEEIDQKFSEVGVNYILTVEDKKSKQFENYIEHYNHKLELIWENDRFKIFKRIN